MAPAAVVSAIPFPMVSPWLTVHPTETSDLNLRNGDSLINLGLANSLLLNDSVMLLGSSGLLVPDLDIARSKLTPDEQAGLPIILPQRILDHDLIGERSSFVGGIMSILSLAQLTGSHLPTELPDPSLIDLGSGNPLNFFEGAFSHCDRSGD